MYKGAHDPEWIADGLSAANQSALIELNYSAELCKAEPGWRDALMIRRPNAPPSLTRQGKAVRAVLLRRINSALAAGSRRAETGNTDSVRSKPERPAGQRPNSIGDTDQ